MHLTTKKTIGMGARAARVLTAAFVVALVGLAMDGRQEASAFPPFSKKENKPCAFCHVKPAGGGPRNEAGKWYKEHGLSFKGYPGLDAGAKKPAAAPVKKVVKPAAKKPVAKKPAAKKPPAKSAKP